MAMYLQTLPETAFVPLPDGVELPGSPNDFRFPLFAIHELERFEREEAAGRILVALAHHKEWAAVRVGDFGIGLLEEIKAMHRAQDTGNRETEFPHSQLFLPDGIARIREGIDELIEQELLGSEDREGDWVVWPTHKLIRLMEPYRVAA